VEEDAGFAGVVQRRAMVGRNGGLVTFLLNKDGLPLAASTFPAERIRKVIDRVLRGRSSRKRLFTKISLHASKSHPATAPTGSNRSSHGGNEVAEAFD
jgi:hypothetical protein